METMAHRVSLLLSRAGGRRPIKDLPIVGEGLVRAFLREQGQDLNLRPSGYEPDKLPGCSTLLNDVFPAPEVVKKDVNYLALKDEACS